MASRLAAALRDLDPEGLKGLDEASLGWLYELPTLAPLLEWLGRVLVPGNVLSTEDMARFQELQKSGRPVLRGDELRQAAEVVLGAPISQAQELARLSDAELKAKLEALEKTHAEEHARAAKLSRQRDILASQCAALRAEQQSLGPAVGSSQAAAEDDDSEMATLAAAQFDRSLAACTEAASDLVARASGGASPAAAKDQTASGPAAPPLSCENLAGLAQQEVKASAALEEYYRRHLSGTALAATKADGPGAFLDSRKALAAASAADAAATTQDNVHEERCRELARLQDSYVLVEGAHMTAAARRALATAQLEAAEKMAAAAGRSTAGSGDCGGNNPGRAFELAAELRSRADESISEFAPLVAEARALAVEASRESFPLPVLEADVDAKLLRQKHYLDRQSRLAGLLLAQRARQTVVEVALGRERQSLARSANVMETLRAELDGLARRDAEQLSGAARLSQLQDDRAVAGRRSADDQDRFVERLAAGCAAPFPSAPSCGAAPPRGSSSFVDLAGLAADLGRVRDGASEALRSREAELAESQAELARARAELAEVRRAVPGAERGELTSPAVQESLDALQAVMQSTSDALDALMRERAALQAAARVHPEDDEAERELFVSFYLAPARMRDMVASLSKRVAAYRSSREH